MMTITTDQIDDVIKKAIGRFIKPYKTESENIQVVFLLNSGNVQYMTCVNKTPQNIVTLKQLIGWNLYNGTVDGKIKSLLQRVQGENGHYVMTGLEKGQVYYHLFNKQNIFQREIKADELLK